MRWATGRAAAIRAKVRSVTGIYNQWPIIISGNQHRLPIDRLPTQPYCIANDNADWLTIERY
jgi:hypothetical protein